MAVSAILFDLQIRQFEGELSNKLARLAYTVGLDLVIFASFNFCEFLILGLFTKLRIREFSYFFSSAIIIVILARF